MYQTITATELKQLLSNDTQINLVDVRTPAEYREVHVQQARNIPLARVTPEYVQADRQNSASSAVYIICRSGARGKQACEKLINSGLTNVINVEGGTMACVAAGIPSFVARNPYRFIAKCRSLPDYRSWQGFSWLSFCRTPTGCYYPCRWGVG